MIVPLLLLASAAASDRDYRAQFEKGLLLCTSPNDAQKTCARLQYGTLHRNGLITVRNEDLYDTRQNVTVKSKAIAEVKSGRLCYLQRVEDMLEATFFQGGRPLAAETTTMLRQQLSASAKAYSGLEFCDELRIRGGNLYKYKVRQGIDLPFENGRPMRWVKASDGFRVAP